MYANPTCCCRELPYTMCGVFLKIKKIVKDVNMSIRHVFIILFKLKTNFPTWNQNVIVKSVLTFIDVYFW